MSSLTAVPQVQGLNSDDVLHWQRFANQAELTQAIAAMLEHEIRFALAERASAWLALAGGRTPFPAYRELARAKLDWSHVNMVATDERWVPRTHPACNARALQEAFGETAIQQSYLVPDFDTNLTPPASSFHASRVLASQPKDFDVVLLGMGEDGHFASIFPNAPALQFDPERVESAHCLTPEPLPPEAPFARVTLSLPRLLRSRQIVLLLTGEAKRNLLEVRRIHRLPIDYLLGACASRGRTIEVFWSPV